MLFSPFYYDFALLPILTFYYLENGFCYYLEKDFCLAFLDVLTELATGMLSDRSFYRLLFWALSWFPLAADRVISFLAGDSFMLLDWLINLVRVFSLIQYLLLTKK